MFGEEKEEGPASGTTLLLKCHTDGRNIIFKGRKKIVVKVRWYQFSRGM